MFLFIVKFLMQDRCVLFTLVRSFGRSILLFFTSSTILMVLLFWSVSLDFIIEYLHFDDNDNINVGMNNGNIAIRAIRAWVSVCLYLQWTWSWTFGHCFNIIYQARLFSFELCTRWQSMHTINFQFIQSKSMLCICTWFTWTHILKNPFRNFPSHSLIRPFIKAHTHFYFRFFFAPLNTNSMTQIYFRWIFVCLCVHILCAVNIDSKNITHANKIKINVENVYWIFFLLQIKWDCTPNSKWNESIDEKRKLNERKKE